MSSPCTAQNRRRSYESFHVKDNSESLSLRKELDTKKNGPKDHKYIISSFFAREKDDRVSFLIKSDPVRKCLNGEGHDYLD